MVISRLARKLRRGSARSIRKNEEGVTAIEFAMIAPVFFFMMGSLMETGIMLFNEYVMQTSVQEAARLVRTGQAQKDGMTATAFKTAICNTATVIANCNSKVTVNMVAAANFTTLASIVPSYLTVGSSYGGGGGGDGSGYSCGGPEQAVALIATFDWDFTMPFLEEFFGNVDGGKKRRLAGIYMFQNEPFPAGADCPTT